MLWAKGETELTAQQAFSSLSPWLDQWARSSETLSDKLPPQFKKLKDHLYVAMGRKETHVGFKRAVEKCLENTMHNIQDKDTSYSKFEDLMDTQAKGAVKAVTARETLGRVEEERRTSGPSQGPPVPGIPPPSDRWASVPAPSRPAPREEQREEKRGYEGGGKDRDSAKKSDWGPTDNSKDPDLKEFRSWLKKQSGVKASEGCLVCQWRRKTAAQARSHDIETCRFYKSAKSSAAAKGGPGKASQE